MEISKLTIKEIKEKIKQLEEIPEDLIDELAADERKGVQKLAQSLIRKREKQLADEEKFARMTRYETNLREKGYELIAGIDEAGRGPLAGPVVAAAVILPQEEMILGLDDSKKLTEKKREELFDIIYDRALAVGVGKISSKRIDEINILQATYEAMQKAVEDLDKSPDYLLVDAEEIPEINISQQGVKKGDSRSVSIAAASIIAKVTRDRILKKFHEKYPYYNFASNKGYGTAEHINALKKHGPTPIHRTSYEVVQKTI